jgi:L-seryl-tRNA(Ser) seleniumtransferase
MQAVEKLLLELTGAEAALVVNNNAAATLLTLTALASGREVIVSRGQLVEIGGSYRLPEVMTASGASLREVGTTNKTRIEDYERAIQDQTAALMRVHPSNYVISGFTEQASLRELITLGRRHDLPVIDDVGSGALVDFSRWGLQGEPMVRKSIEEGADLVLFSGDKLLGGPQAGIVVGRRQSIEKLAQHPLARAVRVDKITLAALAATLRAYRRPDEVELAIPFLQLLSTSVENLQNRAERLAPQLQAAEVIRQAEATAGTAYLGGGAVPSQQIPSWCVVLEPATETVDSLARKLRLGVPAIYGRIQNERLWLDLRTVFPDQDLQIAEAVQAKAVTEEPTVEPT